MAWFLLYDADGHDIKWIKKWLIDPSKKITTGNTTSLEKFEDKIFISSEINEKDKKFEISVEEFLDLINCWNQILKQRPKEIIITKKGDGVTVVGRN